MYERTLSGNTVPFDLLNDVCVFIEDAVNAKGAFLSTGRLDYFDVVKGTMREKRKGAGKDAISMPDLKDVPISKGLYMKGKIYVYHSVLGWFVGVDEPLVTESDAINAIIERRLSPAYSAYYPLLRGERKTNDRDVLTGLWTRKRFYRDIGANIKNILTTKIPLYVFYMDFNNFKAVNDHLGHDMGDRVIMSLSGEARNIFLPYGKLYRLGGDEFVGIIDSGISDDEASLVASRLETVTEQAPCGMLVNLAVGFKKIELDGNVRFDDTGEVTSESIKEIISEVEVKMYKKKSLKRENTIICEHCPIPAKKLDKSKDKC